MANFRNPTVPPTILRATNIAVGPSVSTEVTLIDQAIAPLSANGSIRCTFGGDMLNNSGGTATFQLRIYVGGTKIYDGATSAISASAARRSLHAVLNFENYGAANTNDCFGTVAVGGAGAATLGISSPAGNAITGTFSAGPVAIDTSVPFNFKATLTLSSSNGNLDARIRKVLLEVMP